MSNKAYPQKILQNTLQTLSNTEDIQPSSGFDLIKEWQSALKNTNGTEEVHQKLTDLYDELLNPAPDTPRVQQLLNTLASHTQLLARKAVTDMSDNLVTLADTLRSLADSLNQEDDDNPAPGNNVPESALYNIQDPGDRIQMMFMRTLETLSAGQAAATPEQGATMVDDWILLVRTDMSTQWIEAPLIQLRDALNAGDMRSTERLLRDLAGTSQEYANNNPDGPFSRHLTNLATALIGFAGPLS